MKLGLGKALVATALLLFAVSAAAQSGTVALMDYSGFAWETTGIPTSNPGDELSITAVATTVDPLFGVDASVQEVTIHISGLIVASAVPLPDGSTAIDYSGGMIEIYEDMVLNHDWGVFPPNPELATFTDGTLLLAGSFSRFNLNINAAGFGVYDGQIDGVGGTAAQICNGSPDCAYTFGGAFGRGVGAQIPDGYDLQIDGTLEVDAAVPVETASFGAVKALYR